MLKARTTKEEVVNAIEGLLSAGSPVTLLNVWEAMGKRNERGEIVPEQYTLISQKEHNIFLEKVKSLGRTLPLDKEDEDRVKCRRCLLDDFDNNKKCLTCGESLELGYPLAFSAWGMDFYIDKALISPGGLTFEDFFRDYEKRIVIQLGGFNVKLDGRKISSVTEGWVGLALPMPDNSRLKCLCCRLEIAKERRQQ